MGAATGLVTAIVAGFVAALLGGSDLQVSGPTGAMTVVLVPIVATYGPDGVIAAGLIAGLILIALAASGMGRYVGYTRGGPTGAVDDGATGGYPTGFLIQRPMADGCKVRCTKPNRSFCTASSSVMSCSLPVNKFNSRSAT